MIKKGQTLKLSLATLSRHKKRYEVLGYNINKIKEDNPNIPLNDIYLDIPAEFIHSSGSDLPLYMICDFCNQEYETTWRKYTKLPQGKDACNSCKELKRTNTCIEKYGVTNVFQEFSVKEKSKITCLEKYGVEHAIQNKEIMNKAENNKKVSNKKKYGVESVFSLSSVQQKSKETNLERYGCEYSCQNKDIIAKRCLTVKEKYSDPVEIKKVSDKLKNTMMKRYGYTSALKNPEILAKKTQTMFDLYGEIGSEARKELEEKRKQSNIEKYGVEYLLQNKELGEKAKVNRKAYLMKEYGVTNNLIIPEVKEKIKQKNIEKYGVDSPFKLPTFQEKIRQINILKYGTPYPMQNSEVRRKVFKHKGKSVPESKFEEMLKNRGFIYKYELNTNGKCFDFTIYNIDMTINTIVEIDGEYNHGLKNDSDGFHVHGEKDCERFQKVPDGVKYIVCNSLNIEEGFSQLCSNFDVNYSAWIKEIIDACNVDFPYPEYSIERMKKEYNKLAVADYKHNSYVGQSIIKNFHKSIYIAHVSNKPSPVEAWKNSELLKKCIENRFIYANTLSSQSIADGFNVCKIAPKVSVFRAILARELILKYLNQYDTIFDPFSGFSGRMLGTTCLNKKYIGQDINNTFVKESNEIINFLNLNASVLEKDIFESYGEYDCLFTCSPYNLKETWNNSNQKNLSCDEWIDICLSHFKCKSYLFVVDETIKYKDYIVEEIKNTSHFGRNIEKVILIRK